MIKNYLFILTFIFVGLTFSQGSCPQVFASQDQLLPCTQTCTNISATVFDVGETTTYNVNSIPHSPPIAYNAGGGTGVSVGTDDVWSPIINLPFPFCFFGQTYTTCKIGSNGGVAFAPTASGGYNPWSFSASVPSPALSPAGHVFGPYHDIDPSVAGSVKYYLQGSAPCRKLIVIFDNLGHYSCTSLRSTHMMVFYETTNIIEVYVQQKQTCNGWNSGNTVIGIQNTAGTIGYTPPGRNTGSWTVNTPEAWQFKPSGAPIYSTIEWLENGLVIDTGNAISVCPTMPSTTYTARTTYTRCDGLQIIESDDVTIDFSPDPIVVINPFNLFTCSGQTTTLNALTVSTVDYLWSPGGSTNSSIDVNPVASTTYTVTVTDTASGCTAQATSLITIGAPVANSCNVLYVTPSALSSGSGTKASPIDLSSALEIGACNGTTIKMAIGDYLTDTAITGITSYLTLEGGFDDAVNWEKVSTTGATRILRTATMSTSLTVGSNSIIYGTGIQNEFGPDPKIVAVDVSNQVGFRFQDITIETDGFAGQSAMEFNQGISTIGVQLTSCSDYNFVRTNILTGAASNGYDQVLSIVATDGGSSYGINAIANGANGNIINSNISAGLFGAGGIGAPNGLDGTSSGVAVAGAPLATQDDNFNLVGQAIIRLEDISCTNTLVGYTSTPSGSWSFGANSSPATAVGNSVSTQYSTIGRKDINFDTDLYTGFANILLDDQIIPNFNTSAPLIQGQYRVCAGEFVGFASTNGGVGYVYEWDLGGAAVPNTYSGTGFSSIGAVFNTPGVYTISLNYVTNCCGASVATTIDVFVEEIPVLGMPPDVTLCFGENASTSLTVTGLTTGGSVNWSPPTGLDRIDSTTVFALPLTSTIYTVIMMDSTGVCNSEDSVNITVVDLLLDTATTSANCSVPGTANVNVLPSFGASGNYSYAWSNGANTQMITGLQPDVYQVVVTDNILGCSDSIEAIVNPGPGALFGSAISTDISCFGNNDGKIVVTMQGGMPPYTYAWSNGTTNNTASLIDSIINLSPGNYDLIITDVMGCVYNISTIVEEPSQIIFALDSIRNPTCVGVDDGLIIIRPDGGERPYSFVWTNSMPVNFAFNDVVANNLTTGNYTLILTDSLGCQDSVTVPLIAPLISDTINDTICIGEQYVTPAGTILNLSSDSLVIDSLVGSSGCDSLIVTYIEVNPAYSFATNFVALCQGDNFTLPNGSMVSTEGVYIDTFNTVNGCDSIYTTDIQVDSVLPILISDTICEGENLIINGIPYNAPGQYFDTAFYSISGCDSIHFAIEIKVDSLDVSAVNSIICEGDSLVVNNQTYKTSGLFHDTIRYVNSGCDSLQYTIDLTVNLSPNDTINPQICANETYMLPDASIVNTSGVFHYNDTTVFGCDSLYTVNLTVNPLLVSNVNKSICTGDSIFLAGIWQKTAGVYIDTFAMTSPACDTIITTTLTVNPLPNVIANANNNILCQGQVLILSGSGAASYNWTNGVTDNIGVIQNNVGISSYIVTGEDVNTCINVDTISITVNPSYNTTENRIICEDALPFVFPDGTMHNVNSDIIYPSVLSSITGCDSIITTNLTVNKLGTMGTIPDSIIVCESFNQVLSMSAQNMDSYQWQLDNGFGFSNLVEVGIYSGTSTNELSISPLDTLLTGNVYRIVMYDECGNGPFMDSTYFKVSAPHELNNPIDDVERCLDDKSLIVVDYNGYNYVWSNGQTGQYLQVEESGTYSVNFLEKGTNCKMYDEFDVNIEDCIANCVVLAPTGFSPDASTKNDDFKVVTTCEEGFSFFEFRIYNRWGEEIFFTDNPNKGWDGIYKSHKAEIGVYTYLVEYVKNLKNEKEMLTGNVTLIR